MSIAGRLETVRRWATLLVLALLHLACGESGPTSSGSGGGETPTSVLSAWGSSPVSISLSWTDPSLQFTGTPETKFSTIFRDGARLAEVEGFSYLDEGLQPGTTHSYSVVVTAIYWFVSYVAYSWGSNTAIATTLTDSVAPGVPAQVSAIGLSPSEIQVTWDAVSDNDQVSVYAIYRDGAFVGTSPGTVFVDTGLSVNTLYSYAVAARDRSGNQSALSAPASGMTLAQTIDVDPSATNNAMALDSAGTPHFIYQTYASSGYELRHATWSAGQWLTESLPPCWGDPSLVVDGSDKLHVAVSGAYLTNAPGSWTLQTLPDDGRVPSLALDSGGAAHISYLLEAVDWAGHLQLSVNYVTNASGAWVSEVVTTPPYYSYPVLAWGADRLHLALCLGGPLSPYVLHHATRDAGTWTWSGGIDPLSPDGTAYAGLRPSMVVHSAGEVHVVVRNVYLTNAGGTWRHGFYDVNGTCPAIALDATGAPQIVYKVYESSIGSDVLKLAQPSPTGWTARTVARVTQPAFYLALAIDAAGVRHISYCDGRVVYVRVP